MKNMDDIRQSVRNYINIKPQGEDETIESLTARIEFLEGLVLYLLRSQRRSHSTERRHLSRQESDLANFESELISMIGATNNSKTTTERQRED